MERGKSFEEAVRAAVRELEGSFAIVVMCESEPHRLLAAKSSTPIVIGLGDGEMLIASDIPAILDHTRDVLFLEDGEIAEVTREGVRLTRFDGAAVERKPRRITWDPVTAQKGGFKHFLVKEIHEQPQAIIDTMRGRLLTEDGDVSLEEIEFGDGWWNEIDRIDMVACGTAWHACLVGRFYLEQLARIPCQVDYGSEFRYRDPLLGNARPAARRLAVGRDGRHARGGRDRAGARRRDRSPSATSSTRASRAAPTTSSTPTPAPRSASPRPRRSPPSSPRFSCSPSISAVAAVRSTPTHARDLISHLIGITHADRRRAPAGGGRSRRWRGSTRGARDFLYLGRGINYPIALEGALKLKEISYIHAEGYPAGELKHGPIALIDEDMPVVVIVPRDAVFAKTLSNMKEVESRGGQIIAGHRRASTPRCARSPRDVIQVPTVHPLLMPILITVPLQLLRLPRRGAPRHRRRSAAQSGEERHRRVTRKRA